MTTNRSETEKWIRSVLTGTSHEPPPAKVRRDEIFVLKLLQCFGEISASLDSLQSIVKLTRWSPPSRVGVPKLAHLRLMVETYLNETYLLSLRCQAFLTTIERAYLKTARAVETRRQCRMLRTVTHTAFAPLMAIRGKHVHEARHEEPELKRLETLDLLARTEQLFALMLRRRLRKARREQLDWMQRITDQIHKAMDEYFFHVDRLVFDGDTPRYPAPLKSVATKTASAHKSAK